MMTALQFRDYILTQMSAEEALLKLLQGPLGVYDKLKFPEGSEPVHPIIIIANAAMDLGWDFVIEKGDAEMEMRGLTVGSREFMKEFKWVKR